MCEPTVYRAEDGRLVMLLRDVCHSHRMYASYFDESSRCWSEALPTDIPDSPSKSVTLNLDTGTVLLVGNQVAPEFDNADQVRSYVRNPLTVAVSPDGYRFEQVYALRAETTTPRIEGVLNASPGYQYPTAIVHQDDLLIIYSENKQDICTSTVALTDIVA